MMNRCAHIQLRLKSHEGGRTALSCVDSIVVSGQLCHGWTALSWMVSTWTRFAVAQVSNVTVIAQGIFWRSKIAFSVKLDGFSSPLYPAACALLYFLFPAPPPQNSHQSQSSTLNLTSVCTKIEKVGVPRSCLPLDHSSSECKQKPYLTTGTRRRDGAALTSDPGESTVYGQLISFRRTFSRRTGLPHYRWHSSLCLLAHNSLTYF